MTRICNNLDQLKYGRVICTTPFAILIASFAGATGNQAAVEVPQISNYIIVCLKIYNY